MRRCAPPSRATVPATHSATCDARVRAFQGAHSMRSFAGAGRDASIEDAGALPEDDPRTDKFTALSPVMTRRSSSESAETLYCSAAAQRMIAPAMIGRVLRCMRVAVGGLRAERRVLTTYARNRARFSPTRRAFVAAADRA